MSLKGSVTLAAIVTLAVKVGVSEDSIVHQFSDYLLSHSKERVTDVVLNQPMSVTTKKPAGGYSKRSMIGDEPLLVVGAYMGKRDGVIIQAKVADERSVETIEFPAKTAEDVLEGYPELVESIISSYGMTEDLDDMADARTKAALLEQQVRDEEIRKIRMSDDRFGSW
jgi:hypothetical protein